MRWTAVCSASGSDLPARSPGRGRGFRHLSLSYGSGGVLAVLTNSSWVVHLRQTPRGVDFHTAGPGSRGIRLLFIPAFNCNLKRKKRRNVIVVKNGLAPKCRVRSAPLSFEKHRSDLRFTCCTQEGNISCAFMRDGTRSSPPPPNASRLGF